MHAQEQQLETARAPLPSRVLFNHGAEWFRRISPIAYPSAFALLALASFLISAFAPTASAYSYAAIISAGFLSFAGVTLGNRRERQVFFSAALASIAFSFCATSFWLHPVWEQIMELAAISAISSLLCACSLAYAAHDAQLQAQIAELTGREEASMANTRVKHEGLSLALLTIVQFGELVREVVDSIEGRALAMNEISSIINTFRTSSDHITDGVARQSSELARIQRLGDTLNSSQNTVGEVLDELQQFTMAADSDLIALNSTAAENINVIHGIRESFGELMQIKDYVDQVADRTNLLAINASIEAARMGSAGNGFAVVAGEIEKLATFNREQGDAITTIIERNSALIENAGSIVAETSERLIRQSDGLRTLGATIERLAEIRSTHDSDSAELLGGIRDIRESGDGIVQQANRQRQRSMEVMTMLEQLSMTTETLRKSTGTLTMEFKNLEDHAEQLAMLSQNNTSTAT